MGRGRRTLTRKPRVKREKKRKTVRARKRTRRMPNKNPLNQKTPCQTLTDTLTKLSKNSSHHTHHRNVLLIIYTSYINLPHLSQSSQTQAVQYFLHLSPPPAVPTTPHTLKKQDFSWCVDLTEYGALLV